MQKDASVNVVGNCRWDFNEGIHVVDHVFGGVLITVKHGSRLDHLLTQLKSEFPTLAFEFKASLWYWKVIHYFLLIVSFGQQKKFLSGYTTTIGMLIGFGEEVQLMIEVGKPGSPWEDRLWALLMHEREHLLDFKRFGVFLMTLLYVFVFFPIGLAWGRAWIERRGFIQSLRATFVCDRALAESSEYRAWWISRFTGWSYILMWPFKWQVAKWFDGELADLRKLDYGQKEEVHTEG